MSSNSQQFLRVLTASVNGDKGVIAILEIGLFAQSKLGSNPALLVARSWASHGRGSKRDNSHDGSRELHFEN
jgi:hypothetical protein